MWIWLVNISSATRKARVTSHTAPAETCKFLKKIFFKKLKHLSFITLTLVIFNGSFDKEDVILLQSKINNDMLIFREKRHQKTETLQYLTKRKIRDLKNPPTKNWLIHTTSDVITIFNSLCLLVPLCVSLISIH